MASLHGWAIEGLESGTAGSRSDLHLHESDRSLPASVRPQVHRCKSLFAFFLPQLPCYIFRTSSFEQAFPSEGGTLSRRKFN